MSNRGSPDRRRRRVGVVGREVTLITHKHSEWLSFIITTQWGIFYQNILNVTRPNMGPHPCMWTRGTSVSRTIIRNERESWELLFGALTYATVFNEPHMTVTLVLSLLGSHGTVRAQYTECSLTQNHITALKTLQLLIVVLPLHRKLTQHAKYAQIRNIFSVGLKRWPSALNQCYSLMLAVTATITIQSLIQETERAPPQ